MVHPQPVEGAHAVARQRPAVGVEGLARPVPEFMDVAYGADPARVGDRLGRGEREIGAAREGFQKRSLRTLAMTRGTEIGRIADEARQVGVFGEDRPDVDAPRREQELVQVEEGDPACLVGIAPDAVAIGRQLADFDRPVMERNHAAGDPRRQHLGEIVPAEVVVEIKMTRADAGVEGQPFVEERRLVPEYRGNGERMARPSPECLVPGPGAQDEGVPKPGLEGLADRGNPHPSSESAACGRRRRRNWRH